MVPTTSGSIPTGNFENNLQGHAQNIFNSAQYIEKNYNTPEWKNNVDNPDVAHKFARDIMEVCNKYRDTLNLDFSNLVGSGTGSGSGSPGGSGGTSGGGGSRST